MIYAIMTASSMIDDANMLISVCVCVCVCVCVSVCSCVGVCVLHSHV